MKLSLLAANGFFNNRLSRWLTASIVACILVGVVAMHVGHWARPQVGSALLFRFRKRLKSPSPRRGRQNFQLDPLGSLQSGGGPLRVNRAWQRQTRITGSGRARKGSKTKRPRLIRAVGR